MRMRSQRLLPGSELKSVAAAASKALAIQAQDVPAAALGVRARTAGLTAERARRQAARDSVCRSWLMRNTIFLFASRELAWMRPLLASRPLALAERRLRDLGGSKVAEEVLAELPALLARGPLERSALRAMLAERGATEAGIFYWVPHLAALRGILVARPALDNRQRFVAAPPDEPLDREAALARLGRRYLESHGPATPEDLAYWAKMPKGEARLAFEAAGKTVPLATERGVMVAPAWATTPPGLDERPFVRLLGWFDHYLLSWKRRDLTLPGSAESKVSYSRGVIAPTAFADGLGFATWRIERGEPAIEVVVQPFDRLPRGARPGLEREVAEIGRFLEADASLRIAR